MGGTLWESDPIVELGLTFYYSLSRLFNGSWTVAFIGFHWTIDIDAPPMLREADDGC